MSRSLKFDGRTDGQDGYGRKRDRADGLMGWAAEGRGEATLVGDWESSGSSRTLAGDSGGMDERGAGHLTFHQLVL